MNLFELVQHFEKFAQQTTIPGMEDVGEEPFISDNEFEEKNNKNYFGSDQTRLFESDFINESRGHKKEILTYETSELKELPKPSIFPELTEDNFEYVFPSENNYLKHIYDDKIKTKQEEINLITDLINSGKLKKDEKVENKINEINKNIQILKKEIEQPTEHDLKNIKTYNKMRVEYQKFYLNYLYFLKLSNLNNNNNKIRNEILNKSTEEGLDLINDYLKNSYFIKIGKGFIFNNNNILAIINNLFKLQKIISNKKTQAVLSHFRNFENSLYQLYHELLKQNEQAEKLKEATKFDFSFTKLDKRNLDNIKQISSKQLLEIIDGQLSHGGYGSFFGEVLNKILNPNLYELDSSGFKIYKDTKSKLKSIDKNLESSFRERVEILIISKVQEIKKQLENTKGIHDEINVGNKNINIFDKIKEQQSKIQKIIDIKNIELDKNQLNKYFDLILNNSDYFKLLKYNIINNFSSNNFNINKISTKIKNEKLTVEQMNEYLDEKVYDSFTRSLITAISYIDYKFYDIFKDTGFGDTVDKLSSIRYLSVNNDGKIGPLEIAKKYEQEYGIPFKLTTELYKDPESEYVFDEWYPFIYNILKNNNMVSPENLIKINQLIDSDFHDIYDNYLSNFDKYDVFKVFEKNIKLNGNLNNIEKEIKKIKNVAVEVHNTANKIDVKQLDSLLSNNFTKNPTSWLSEQLNKLMIKIINEDGVYNFIENYKKEISDLKKSGAIKQNFEEKLNYFNKIYEEQDSKALHSRSNNDIQMDLRELSKSIDMILNFQSFKKYYEIASKPENKKIPELFKLNDNINPYLRFRVLKDLDYDYFNVGPLTDCCQTIGGAGENALIDSFINPEAGVVVLEIKNGNDWDLVSQSYFHYVPKDNGVILDNVEVAPKYEKELKSPAGNDLKIEDIYANWAKNKKQELGLNYFLSGKSYSGISKEEFETSSMKEDKRRFEVDDKYTDYNSKNSIDLINPKFDPTDVKKISNILFDISCFFLKRSGA